MVKPTTCLPVYPPVEGRQVAGLGGSLTVSAPRGLLQSRTCGKARKSATCTAGPPVRQAGRRAVAIPGTLVQILSACGNN